MRKQCTITNGQDSAQEIFEETKADLPPMRCYRFDTLKQLECEILKATEKSVASGMFAYQGYATGTLFRFAKFIT